MMATNDADADRWQKVLDRRAGLEGGFVYAVTTTGIYCRPDCPSRRPKRENVRFFDGPAAAEAAGYRPCRRCRPEAETDPHAARIAAACERLRGEAPPPLAELAAEAGLSPYHFHRLFTQATGLTPRRFAAACRADRFRAALDAGQTVTAATYEAGYGSPSRLHGDSAAPDGVAPSAYRKGGAGLTLRWAVAPCWLGLVLVAATDRGICAIALGDDATALRADLAARFPRAALVPGGDGFDALIAAAVATVERPDRPVALPLDVQGTAFQQRVWRALRALPPGTTTTYGALAAALGQPSAVRAVAGACAGNPVAVAVPCHRVIGRDGGLHGYRWGLERKRALLDREAGANARRQVSLVEKA